MLVFFQPIGETPKLGNSALQGLGQPFFESPCLLLRDHPPETHR